MELLNFCTVISGVFKSSTNPLDSHWILLPFLARSYPKGEPVFKILAGFAVKHTAFNQTGNECKLPWIRINTQDMIKHILRAQERLNNVRTTALCKTLLFICFHSNIFL